MSDLENLQKRVTQLEEISSHQEHLIQQLNQVIMELRMEHDQYRARTKLQLEQLESQIDSRSVELDPDEKPPHY